MMSSCVCGFQESDNSVRLKIASLLGLLSKTQGFSPDCIVDDAVNTLSNESMSGYFVRCKKHLCRLVFVRYSQCLFLCVSESHQVLAQLLDTLLIIGTQLPDKTAVIQRLIDVACKVKNILYVPVF